MNLYKAGECLNYGLGRELMLGDKAEIKNYHLKVFVTYFGLVGYIKRDDISRIVDILIKDRNMQKVFVLLTNIIVKNLKEHFEFEDTDSLFNALNTIEIPYWVFRLVPDLFDVLPNAYYVDDRIYYIVNIADKYYFRSVDPNETSGVKLFRRIWDGPFNDDDFGCTISTNYSKILSYDENSKIFYLRSHSVYDLYCEYHVDTKQEHLKHYRCVGVLSKKYPVVFANGYLSVIVNNKIKNLKEKDFYENYCIKNDRIFVTMTSISQVAFKPYYLDVEGNRTEASYSEAKEYLIDSIDRDTMGQVFGSSQKFALKKTDILSFKVLNDCFCRDNLDLDETYILVYKRALEILKKYLSEDDDIVDILYAISDASKKLKKMISIHFMYAEGVARLEELHLAGKLKEVISDAKKLNEALLEGEEWDDKRLKGLNAIVGEGSCGQIGCFDIENGMLTRVTKGGIEKGQCIGNQLILPNAIESGIVSKNIENGIYEVQFNRELSEDEIDMILEEFSIDECFYHIIIDYKTA